jgi:hypothetical protein
MVLIGLGAGMVIAYQKLNEPAKEKMEELMCAMKEKATEKLEDMM